MSNDKSAPRLFVLMSAISRSPATIEVLAKDALDANVAPASIEITPIVVEGYFLTVIERDAPVDGVLKCAVIN